jgi:hypothetical protein
MSFGGRMERFHVAQPGATNSHLVIGLLVKNLLESAGVELGTCKSGKDLARVGLPTHPRNISYPYSLELLFKLVVCFFLGGKGSRLRPNPGHIYHAPLTYDLKHRFFNGLKDGCLNFVRRLATWGAT